MKRSLLNRLAVRVLAALAGCLLFAAALAPAASADPTCVSENLATLISVTPTCDIGSLQFTFGSLVSVTTIGTAWTASDFGFTPVINGFSLSFDGGLQSITTSSDDGGEFEYAELIYSVTDLDGNLTGESATGGALSGSANGGVGAAQGGAFYDGRTFSSGSAVVEGYNEVFNGTISQYENGLGGAPFSYGPNGQAYPFYVYALYGGSASWDGSPTTFTYDTETTLAPIPEPSTLLLFGTGLLGIVFITRKKLAHYNNR